MKSRKFVVFILIIGIAACIFWFVFFKQKQTDEQENVMDENPYGMNVEITQGEIVQSFEENYEIFQTIANYILNRSEGEFYLFKHPDGTVVDGDGNFLAIEALEISVELDFILENLNYVSVRNVEDAIYFDTFTKASNGGIVYMGNSTAPEPHENNPYILIRDNWYYYEFYGT